MALATGDMDVLLAIQRGDCGALRGALDALPAAAVATDVDAGAGAGAGSSPAAAIPAALLGPGCRAVVTDLPKRAAQHNGGCLVIRCERATPPLYAVRCDSGAQLLVKPANLSHPVRLGAADAMWLACQLLQPEAAAGAKGRRQEMVEVLLEARQRRPGLLHALGRAAGPMLTTPLLECLHAGAFSSASLLLARAAPEQPGVLAAATVGEGHAKGAPALLVACSYTPERRPGEDEDEDEDEDEVGTTGGARRGTRAAVAAVPGLAGTVADLLHYGADPNGADSFGRTPALACVITAQLDALRVLLEHNAAPARLDLRCKQSGLTALGAAFMLASEYPEIAQLVEKTAAAQGERVQKLAQQEKKAAVRLRCFVLLHCAGSIKPHHCDCVLLLE
jgi:hypothetical protein